MNKTAIDPARSIPAYYAGQSIFLTGGTGFIGKIFIEKVLRSCPEIREIFMLIRPRKGMSADERLEKFKSLQVFDRVREEQPANLQKLIPISGNASMKELGISAADRQTLIERVTIVVHSSASVKFNENLTYAILTNSRSTRDICMLAENMKNLLALVYISSTYQHTDEHYIMEEMYPPKADWRKTIEIAESMDEHVLSVFTSKYMGNKANTYVFTKNLSEGIIHEYSATLPCTIFRTSMVTPAVSEPFPGWVDNVYGPMGSYFAAAKGVMRVGYMDPDAHHDLIPVDTVIKSLIQVIWKRGLATRKNPTYLATQKPIPLVFNCATGGARQLAVNKSCTLGKSVMCDEPLEDAIWTLDTFFVDNYTVYFTLMILWHILPALLIDRILKSTGRKPILFNLQRMMFIVACALYYFSTNTWTFENANVMAINEEVPPDNVEDFQDRWTAVDRKEFFRISMRGGKIFLFNEGTSPSAIEAAKAHYRKVELFVMFFRTSVFIGMLWLAYKWSLLSFVLRFFQSGLFTRVFNLIS